MIENIIAGIGATVIMIMALGPVLLETFRGKR